MVELFMLLLGVAIICTTVAFCHVLELCKIRDKTFWEGYMKGFEQGFKAERAISAKLHDRRSHEHD